MFQGLPPSSGADVTLTLNGVIQQKTINVSLKKKETQFSTSWTFRGGRAPRRQVRVPQLGVTTQPLRDLLGSLGIFDVLPPGQGGTQQAQGLPRAGGTLQNPVHPLQHTPALKETERLDLSKSTSFWFSKRPQGHFSAIYLRLN